MRSDDDATLITSSALIAEDSVDDDETRTMVRDAPPAPGMLGAPRGVGPPYPARPSEPPAYGGRVGPQPPRPAAGQPVQAPSAVVAPNSGGQQDPDRRVLPFGGTVSMQSPLAGMPQVPPQTPGRPAPTQPMQSVPYPVGASSASPSFPAPRPPSPSAPAFDPPRPPMRSTPNVAAFEPPPGQPPAIVMVTEPHGTPRIVIRFLAVCGVFTALGLVALICLEL